MIDIDGKKEKYAFKTKFGEKWKNTFNKINIKEVT